MKTRAPVSAVMTSLFMSFLASPAAAAPQAETENARGAGATPPVSVPVALAPVDAAPAAVAAEPNPPAPTSRCRITRCFVCSVRSNSPTTSPSSAVSTTCSIPSGMPAATPGSGYSLAPRARSRRGGGRRFETAVRSARVPRASILLVSKPGLVCQSRPINAASWLVRVTPCATACRMDCRAA